MLMIVVRVEAVNHQKIKSTENRIDSVVILRSESRSKEFAPFNIKGASCGKERLPVDVNITGTTAWG